MKLDKQIRLELEQYTFKPNTGAVRAKAVQTLNDIDSGYIFKDVTTEDLAYHNLTVFNGTNKETNKIMVITISPMNEIKIYK